MEIDWDDGRNELTDGLRRLVVKRQPLRRSDTLLYSIAPKLELGYLPDLTLNLNAVILLFGF